MLYTLFKLVSLVLRRWLAGILFFVARILMDVSVWLLYSPPNKTQEE